MKILIFLHGTIIMHNGAKGKTRKQIIQQVIDEEKSVRDYRSYIPIGNASEKLQAWAKQGAEICYLSALTTSKKVRGDEIVGEDGLKADDEVLKRYGFPKGEIYHRESNEDYRDVVERINPLPTVLIEDDCESIGGINEMTFTHLSSEIKSQIKSIPVKEFSGIDQLFDNIEGFKIF